jgi:hypothetical protein
VRTGNRWAEKIRKTTEKREKKSGLDGIESLSLSSTGISTSMHVDDKRVGIGRREGRMERTSFISQQV